MICGTTGTSGTCGTSFEEHVVLVVHVVLLWEHREQEEQQLKQHTDIASHVIHPDPVRNNIRIRCTKICVQACINLVHNKKPQHLCRGFLSINNYYYSFTSTSMSSYTSFSCFISFSLVIKLNISCSISSKVLPSSLQYVIWFSTSFSQNISFCNM
jgi:hypothetical protein